jgi:glycine/D-amino acid oxidase-like deaminating enzyme
VTLPPIERACFWLATRPAREPCAPLAGRSEADVAIVGGGYTGLWTALVLKELEPRLEVALLEGEICGYGGSGRNAGILGETLDHSHELAAVHFGVAEARRLAALGRENLAELAAFLSARKIDAGFERTGQLFVALTPAQAADVQAAAAVAPGWGAPDWRYLDADEARREVASPLYRGALLVPGGAIVDPVRLVDGLLREARAAGVRVYERSPVLGFAFAGGGVTARTAAGRVAARRAVLAANAWAHRLLPRLARRFLPLYDYLLASEPLTAAQRAAIGWRRRQGVLDARTFFNYYRLTADDRVVWGTSEAVYHRPNRVAPALDHSPAHYAALRESFRRHFPALADLEFPYAWGGPICATTRLTPFFGRAAGGRLVYGLGYTGHGIAPSRVAGRILAHLALGRPSPLLDLAMVRRPPLPYPPEPVRSLAVGAVRRALRRVDAGGRPGLGLRLLRALGVGFSS